ncbi:hypothetical protein FA95DRAFT_826507 [Auriscalpium vulgare]|uniref:Uncharacterized protein n=1 Tax=Auriscalpium vulgare TaxID=40419 RepID=A0ACB8R9Y7_9AGAM|nr:hypothetical protein FA95DRAFT_826507 [Auriscalpium vulgare]
MAYIASHPLPPLSFSSSSHSQYGFCVFLHLRHHAAPQARRPHQQHAPTLPRPSPPRRTSLHWSSANHPAHIESTPVALLGLLPVAIVDPPPSSSPWDVVEVVSAPQPHALSSVEKVPDAFDLQPRGHR